MKLFMLDMDDTLRTAIDLKEAIEKAPKMLISIGESVTHRLTWEDDHGLHNDSRDVNEDDIEYDKSVTKSDYRHERNINQLINSIEHEYNE